jgi:glycerophosphoryl diester phosphodiesterase
VHELSYSQLQRFNASKAAKGYFAPTTIPLLKEVLERMKDSEAQLIIEIKDPSLYPGISERLAAIINDSHMANRVLIFSFDPEIVFAMKQLVPQVKTGIFSVGPEQLNLAGKVDYYCPSFVSLLYYPGLIKKIHAKGCKAFAWTVDSSFWIKFLLHHNVDGIISNDPKLCAGIYR